MSEFSSSLFEGFVPKVVTALGVMRLERVRGATAVTHETWDHQSTTRYEIAGDRICRPGREPSRQFLVVEAGCRLSFETDSNEVFIAGVIVSDDHGKRLEARECVGIPVPTA